MNKTQAKTAAMSDPIIDEFRYLAQSPWLMLRGAVYGVIAALIIWAIVSLAFCI